MADRDAGARDAQLQARIRKRMRSVPLLFRGHDPAIREGLWKQLEAGYLDNPLPSSLKSRLFVYLARFYDGPHGLIAHLDLAVSAPSGDESRLDGAAVLALVGHPLPRGEALHLLLTRFAEAPPNEELPEPGSQEERDLIDCAAHVVFAGSAQQACRRVLRRVLSPERYEQLVAFVGFAQLARAWVDAHPEVATSEEAQQVLREHEELVSWSEQRWEERAAPRDEGPDEIAKRFQYAFDAAGALVYESELDSDRIVAMHGLENLLGEDSALPRTQGWWRDRLHPEERDWVRAEVDRAIEADSGLRLSYRVRHADGRWLHVLEHATIVRDAAGRPRRQIGVLVDVSARRAVEAQLRSRTAELEAIVENMADGVIVQNERCEIVRLNRAAVRATGQPSTAEAVRLMESLHEVGGGCVRCLDRDGAPMVYDESPMAKSARFEPFRGLEMTFLNEKSGRRFTGMFSGLPMPGADGGRRLFVTTFQDVTERKATENELRASEQRLRELSERKDEFLAMLGHELRNPLSTIRNAADMLKLMNVEDERIERLRRVLDRQSAHMAKLVDGLLDAARVVRGKVRLDRQVVNLAAVVRNTVSDRTEQAERGGIELSLELPHDEVPVVGDRVRLTQVIDNLLSNALEFTEGGGRIEVQVAAGSEQVTVSVSDDGAGIEPVLLSHLFEPFQQGPQAIDRPKGGLGLGLALVRALVERHGGEISAHSEGAGHGARFDIVLPLASRQVAEARESDRGLAVSRRILVVEDEPDHAATLRMLLETLGHQVDVAGDGPTALSLARSGRPDLVLCDLGLPGDMSGYDVAAAFSAAEPTRDIYLVALTGYARAEDRCRAERAGFDDFLPKPAGAEGIRAALRRAFEGEHPEEAT